VSIFKISRAQKNVLNNQHIKVGTSEINKGWNSKTTNGIDKDACKLQDKIFLVYCCEFLINLVKFS
jgi:hypothetical protein